MNAARPIPTMAQPRKYGAVTRIRQIMDRLDVEDDDNVRAELLDEAAGLADEDVDARAEWAGYR